MTQHGRKTGIRALNVSMGIPFRKKILISVSSSNGKRHVIHRKRKSITVIPVRGNISASRAFRKPFIIFTLLAILSHEGELHKNPLLHSDFSYALFFAL